MFGIRIVREKEYQELKDKLDKLMDIDTILEKQEKHIWFVCDSIFENNYQKLVIVESAKIQNIGHKLKEESDFIKLSIIELLDLLKQTDIVKKDKKLTTVFQKAIANTKKRLNIIDNKGKSNEEILKEIQKEEKK